MDGISVLAENIFKIEEELDEPLTVKTEVKAENDDEEELQPPAFVFVEPKEGAKEEVAEEYEDPLAPCYEDFCDASVKKEEGCPSDRDLVMDGPISKYLAPLETTVEEKDLPIHRKICTKDVVAQMQIGECERQFECSVCQRRFSQKGNLIVHMRIHTGEKPEECYVCQRRFTKRGTLVRHMMTHTGERPEECSVCQMRFTHKGNLVVHMRTHTGEKPEECCVCQKRFRKRGCLVRHMRIHTGEKPEECGVCQKRFTDRGTLFKHIRTHTWERREKCLPEEIYSGRIFS